MWKKIINLRNTIPNDFHTLEAGMLPSGLRKCLASKIYYTPKLQKFAFTNEL